MGSWGTEPWQSDRARNWLDEMFALTGLAEHLEETLHRRLDDGIDEGVRPLCEFGMEIHTAVAFLVSMFGLSADETSLNSV